MDLTTWEAARPWAKAIRDEVLVRRMPPWGPVKGIGDFAGDPSLSQPEIDMLVAWVEGGAPEGDAAELPVRLPSFKLATPGMPRYTQTLNVTKETAVSRASMLVALRPKDLPDGGSLEGWATEPDGTIERLIWLPDYRKSWTRSYVLRNPLSFPAGTRLRVAGSAGSLIFYFK